MTGLFDAPEWRLATALAIGLIIGTERERRKRGGRHPSAAGLRTYGLVALMGGLVAFAGSAALTLVVAGFVAVGALMAHSRALQRVGPTGGVALLLAFVLGHLAMARPDVAVAAGLVATVLLACRVELHRFVRTALTRRDMLDGLTFLAAAFVVLPLAPDRAIDPWGLVNPLALWRLAVVLMGLSALGYIALRAIGPRYGLTIAGFIAGFVSSTVAIATMGARAKADARLTASAAAGAVAAVLGSLMYLIALVATVDPRLFWRLWPAFAGALAPTAIYASLLGLRALHGAAPEMPTGRAFDARLAIFFAALVAVFAIAGKALTLWLGASGLVVGSIATGFIDAHATAVSIATLSAAGGAPLPAAGLAVTVGLSVNMAAKIPASFLLGPRPFAIRVSLGLALLLAGLWAGYLAGGA